MGGCPGIQFQAARGRHDQDITQIRMPGAAEMRMAETDNTTVFMLITGTIFIRAGLILSIYIMRDRIRIRT